MVRINTLFIPYRLILSKKLPYVDLEVTVENNKREKKLLSVEITLPHELSFNAGGYVRRYYRKIGELTPGSKKKITVRIYARSTVVPGGYPVKLTVFEHENDYEYVRGETTKELILNAV